MYKSAQNRVPTQKEPPLGRLFWQIWESEQKLRTPPPGEQFLFTVFFLFIEQNAAGVYVFAIKQKT